MSVEDALVSIGLPVRNGELFLEDAVASVLAQDYDDIELVISDNASVDATEEVCREFARSDSRVRYHRQSENIGLVNNFTRVLELAGGAYFKWIGDDDWLTPNYVSRCVEIIADDQRLILVTTRQAYIKDDGTSEAEHYDAHCLRSPQPVDRFAEILRLVNEGSLRIDPLYGMMRRSRIEFIKRINIIGGDEVYAAKLALAGAFGHIPEVLAYRRYHEVMRLSDIAQRLELPSWHVRVATFLECSELLRCIDEAAITGEERRRARVAVARMYASRHVQRVVRHGRKLVDLSLSNFCRRSASDVQ